MALQNVDYVTNIRGWLLGINNPASLVADKDLFGMSLAYHNTSMANSIPQYNGNISEMMYSSAQYDASTSSSTSYNLKAKDAYQYQFTYDKLNRILSGVLQKKATTETAFSDFFRLENMSYDNNGNIKTLNRSIKTGTSLVLADQLAYNYGNTANNNQLLGVADNSNNPQYFKDNGTNNDYTYDDAGNLTKDANKNISNIVYNYLNLPAQITVLGTTNNDGTISYLYVGGQKLVHYANNSKPDKITNYLAGMVYENNTLEFIPTAEGRALLKSKLFEDNTKTGYSYEYSLKDHLGNTRVSCRCGDPKRDPQGIILTGINAGTEPLKVVQENHYDPWGMSLGNDQAQNPISLSDKYLYNGKELIQDLGIDTYDYGARNYDSVLGRWSGVDALAEIARRYSPLVYANNNPMRYIDPDGMASQTIYGFDGKAHEIGDNDVTTIYQAPDDDEHPNQSNVSKKLSENMATAKKNGNLDCSDKYACYPATWARLEQAYEDSEGSVPSVLKTKWSKSYSNSNRIYPNINTNFAILFSSDSQNSNWLKLPIEHRGKGAAGAMVYAGLGEYANVWEGELNPGSVIQFWDRAQTYENVKNGLPLSQDLFTLGHSVIFVGYYKNEQGEISAVKYVDQHGAFKIMKKEESTLVIFGANIKDTQK